MTPEERVKAVLQKYLDTGRLTTCPTFEADLASAIRAAEAEREKFCINVLEESAIVQEDHELQTVPKAEQRLYGHAAAQLRAAIAAIRQRSKQ